MKLNIFDKHEVESLEYYYKVKFTRDVDKRLDALDEFYRYVKSIQNDYFINGVLSKRFKNMSDRVLCLENEIPEIFIMESSPNFAVSSLGNGISKKVDEQIKLNWIIYMVRRKLAYEYDYDSKCNIEKILSKASMLNKCGYSGKLVLEYAKKSGIKCECHTIYPGFIKTPSLYNGYGFHVFNIVKVNDKYYIVDLTYRQFFLKDQSSLERIGICNLTNAMAGRFMIMNESRRNTAYKLLKDGYIEMTDENVKNYFDGFALSYRNATYYEETEDFSFTTDYSPYDYERFITGKDSQYFHEGEKVLGLQKKVLKNPNMSFNK